jgi:hypothetical protein
MCSEDETTWLIKECMIRELMTRATAGEDQDLLLLELHANSVTKEV